MPNGFTLIELLVTFGLISIVMSFSLFESIGALQYHFEQSESSHLTTFITTARGTSLRHVCVSSTCTAPALHGVYVDQSTITLFEGTSFAARDIAQDWVLPHTSLLTSSSLGTVIYATNGSSSTVPSP